MAYPTNPIYKLQKNPTTGVVDQVKTQDSATMPLILNLFHLTLITPTIKSILRG